MEALNQEPASRSDRLAPLLTSLVCLLPLILFWDRFRTLYWFHDDWDLTSEMESLGMLEWMTQRYGENFAPAFKICWQQAIVLVNGSYTGMILLLWITHLAILLLLGSLLRRCGLAWRWQCLAVLTLGMPWSNIETLGWASCWISPLNTLFFLSAWVLLLSAEEKGGFSLRILLALVGALASALTFSRGVFAGGLLAFFKDMASLKGVIEMIPFKSFSLLPAKLGGVLAMFGSIALLAALPWLDRHPVRSGRYRPWYRLALVGFVLSACVLGYVGAQPAEQPWVIVGQLATLYYFAFFLVIVPWLSHNEPVAVLPNSIHEAVLAEGK